MSAPSGGGADGQTLDGYLDDWFELQRTRIEPTSWHNYAAMARIYLRPSLGAIPLAELTTRDLDLHYVRLLERGNRQGGPLARRTVAYAHAVLHKALGDAVRDGLLPANPAARATVPRIDPRFDDAPRRLRTWDAQQVTHFRNTRATASSTTCGGSHSGPACAAANCSACAGRTSTSTCRSSEWPRRSRRRAASSG
ncbi:hypothetical protein [Egicoccus sp. AB-alg2]|uniref:hypothetical protein n=1 Tax=Egicoccus sp. AB-alg2 TaxID=3242693 RepID=UPI00359D2E73